MNKKKAELKAEIEKYVQESFDFLIFVTDFLY